MIRHNLLFLFIKIVLFISSIALLLLPLAIKIHDFQKKYEPRSALFYQDGISIYDFGLLGDSVFCSLYVDNDNDTIWKKFESLTGKKCFPGAVDNLSNVDFINAAKYSAHKMPSFSTIFIDILATRFTMRDTPKNGYHGSEFDDVWLKEKYVIYKYIGYLNVDYLKYLKLIISGKRTDRFKDAYYRIWDVDGNLAKIRYNGFVNQFNKDRRDQVNKKSAPEVNYLLFDEVNDIFRNAKIKAVFVLMPFNKSLIYAYSDKKQADQIYFKLNKTYETTKAHLNEIKASYIDLSGAFSDNCFVDLYHPNAKGDEIIARSLADYVAKEGK
jgi:hypothetical protein